VADALAPLVELVRPYRLANDYHLFTQITRDRIEPEFQTLANDTWHAQHLRYKPGDPKIAPPLVAPHQPRVDFLLWFHGLDYRSGSPPYVNALIRKLCADPETIQPLFRTALPAHAEAIRLEYWLYRFTAPSERRETGEWWRRRSLAISQTVICNDTSRARSRKASPEPSR
jgi:hypothetical protein